MSDSLEKIFVFQSHSLQLEVAALGEAGGFMRGCRRPELRPSLFHSNHTRLLEFLGER